MVTHDDHTAFAKQAAEAVYPVSDDTEDAEDDKGWGAKEWLSLALASGTLAAGLGAAYLYRKEIGDFLKPRIGGDSRGPLDKFTGEHLGGISPGTLTGIASGVASVIPATRKHVPGGDAYRQKTTAGLGEIITKGGTHADALTRQLSNTVVPGMTPEDTGKAVHRYISDATVNPKNVIAELSSSDDILKNPGTGKPITMPTKWSWLRDPLQRSAGREQANFMRNAKTIQDLADSARTKLYSSGHNFGSLTPAERTGLEYSKRVNETLGKGFGIDPVTKLPLEHAKSVNIASLADNLAAARGTLPSKGIGGHLRTAGMGWLVGTGANGLVNWATGH